MTKQEKTSDKYLRLSSLPFYVLVHYLLEHPLALRKDNADVKRSEPSKESRLKDDVDFEPLRDDEFLSWDDEPGYY